MRGMKKQGKVAGEEGGIKFWVFCFVFFKKKEIAALMYACGNDLDSVTNLPGLPGMQDLQF